MMNTSGVCTRIEGRVGRITLHRPDALHALTTEMCREMTAALLGWERDPSVVIVLLDHSGERGFCAGGDILMLAESGKGDGAAAREFFSVEYRLNHLLFGYSKPTIAVMDGVTMGGGVGLSWPCRFRIATERTTLAMPETGIGLFPDVGGGWYLPRMPDHIGMWLGLTGARIRAADCQFLGIATHCVQSADVAELKADIVLRHAPLEEILAAFQDDPGDPPLRRRRDEIRAGFSAANVEMLLARLEAGSAWQREQREIILGRSPEATKVTFERLRQPAAAFAENMELEYRAAIRMISRHDFQEGVTALLVEKRPPSWSPNALSSVSKESVTAILAPLPPEEAWAPLVAA